jgi:UDP-GlcNAc:undecaprenyl-phosphate GlcNAc-1-phosphate transferase
MPLLFLDLIVLVASLLICANAEAIGHRLSVIDHPDQSRKRHGKATPLVGGIAILLPFFVWLVGVLVGHAIQQTQALYMLLICVSAISIVGFADDQTPTTPLSRILMLLVVLGAAFVIDPDLLAANLNWGSFDPTPLPAWAYCALIALTTVGIVNAVNMADGQNGLVPGMFFIWAICLALVGDTVVAAASEVIALASLVVLLFNLRGKLFLGDCGSYGVTFALGLLSILTYSQGRVTIETVTVWFFIPVADCLRLIITRRLQGRSPVTSDSDHFHHRLQGKLGTHYGLFAYIASVAGTSFVAALAPHFALVCLIALTAIYFSFAWLTDPVELAVATGESGVGTGLVDPDRSGRNVVSIAGTEKKQSH